MWADQSAILWYKLNIHRRFLLSPGYTLGVVVSFIKLVKNKLVECLLINVNRGMKQMFGAVNMMPIIINCNNGWYL